MTNTHQNGNGVLSYPGLPQETPRACLIGGDSPYNEEQVVRLMLQELRDRGFTDTFNQLQSESGYRLEEEPIAGLRADILAGKWTEVVGSLPSIIGAGSQADRDAAQFIIKRQQFLELLEARQLKQALLVLQNELSGLTDDTPQLHRLSGLLMCPSPADLRAAAQWGGSGSRSRLAVLGQLQRYIPPGRMVAAHRMETLFGQATRWQQARCERHLVDGVADLLTDHECTDPLFPQDMRVSLEGHGNEVWYVAFSPDGRYLASASRDKTCIIWSTTDYSIVHRLEGHSGEVSYLEWAPDSTRIVSASSDKTLRLWDVESGQTLKTFDGHTETVASCKWLGQSDRFVSGGMDKKIIIWDARGQMVRQISSPRVHDIAISDDASLMLVADDRTTIHAYDLSTLTLLYKLEEQAEIMSLALSSDALHCLTELRNGQLHMWDLAVRARQREFRGHRQGQYVIRCTFAGGLDQFVATGSEDGSICVWSRESGRLLTRLKGHTKTINGCAWSSKVQALATAADDQRICIWPIRNKQN